MQHDCVNSHCDSTTAVPKKQERLITSQTKDVINHAPTNSYIVNTSSLHNYSWIRAAVPRGIYDQIYAPVTSDHMSVRLHAARLLRSKKGADEPADGKAKCDVGTLPAEHPAFDPPKRARGKGKGKAEAPLQHPNGSNSHIPPSSSFSLASGQAAYMPSHSNFNHQPHGPPIMYSNAPQSGPSISYGARSSPQAVSR